MDTSDNNYTTNNDNNNAVYTNPPSIILTTDSPRVDFSIVGAGDSDDGHLKACRSKDGIQYSSGEQLIIGSENYEHLNERESLVCKCSDSDSNDLNRLEFEEPSLELSEKIRQQVEFYLSDENILKDAFLLKHVRRNKLGFVSLKLIASFKKMKSLTKDYRAVAYSLRESDKLLVNEEGNKVRRIQPLPDYDETVQSRTIVITNIPNENASVDGLGEIFGKYGDISYIRLIRPSTTIPQDVKRYIYKYPEISKFISAIIEFESYNSANNAYESLSHDNLSTNMRAFMLTSKASEVKKNSKSKNNSMENSSDNFNKLKSHLTQIQNSSDCNIYRSGSDSNLSRSHDNRCESLNFNKQIKPSNRNLKKSSMLNVSHSAGSSPWSSPEIPRRSGPHRNDMYDHGKSWLQRRFKVNCEKKNGSDTSPRMYNMIGVLRQPRGPDVNERFLNIGRGRIAS